MKKQSIAILIFIITIISTLLPAHYAYCKNAGKVTNGSLSYEIMKYSRMVSGHKWRYVLIDEKATKRDVETIYNDLRSRYPNDYFELFNNMETLTAMYKNSIRRGKFPDTKGHLGMINQMGYDQEWKFTSMSGYSQLSD